MKNLKKLSRNELKKMIGGLKDPNRDMIAPGEGGGSGSTYQCCSDLYTCGACSTGSNCPSGYFLRAC
ncbi:bacteriocin-like protein [Chryseobacterium kwangjuense]|uniref:bacteriocin-like protein n=1 Tax=Chryseobacterium kwangjuense TaxID=267125 RepID=UPI00104201E2|nr:hypothetical protein [Chryseobacterium kwangjuense]